MGSFGHTLTLTYCIPAKFRWISPKLKHKGVKISSPRLIQYMYPVLDSPVGSQLSNCGHYSLGWVSHKHPNTETIFVPLWAASTERLLGSWNLAVPRIPFTWAGEQQGEKGGNTESGCWRAGVTWIQTCEQTHTFTQEYGHTLTHMKRTHTLLTKQ